MTTTRAHILENVLPQFELPNGDEALDMREILNSLEVVVDFGCGMGDATLSLLEVGHSVLALDVHTPGICRIAEVAKDSGFQNLALVHGDGIPVLQDRLKADSIKTGPTSQEVFQACHLTEVTRAQASACHVRRLF